MLVKNCRHYSDTVLLTGEFCVHDLNSEVILKGEEFELIIAFKKVVELHDPVPLSINYW